MIITHQNQPFTLSPQPQQPTKSFAVAMNNNPHTTYPLIDIEYCIIHSFGGSLEFAPAIPTLFFSFLGQLYAK